MNERNMTVLRLVLVAAAVVLFLCAWFISLGKDVFDSTNAGAFGYFALALLAASFLP